MRNLAAFNGVVIVLLVTYAWYIKMSVTDIIPLVPDRDPGIDARRAAGHLYPRVGARLPGSRKAGRPADTPPPQSMKQHRWLFLVRRQDRHADPNALHGYDRSTHAEVRRGHVLDLLLRSPARMVGRTRSMEPYPHRPCAKPLFRMRRS